MRCNRCSKVLLGTTLMLGAAWASRATQQAVTPGLHRRSEGSAAGQEQAGNSRHRGVSTLPDDVSGAYAFDHLNESIEIDIERGKLDGYISQLGDAETDSKTPVTFFFDKTSIDGSELEFQTRVVHGVWYSFHGTIFRGDAADRDEQGYYVLHGTLVEHHPQAGGEEKSADETIARRVVNFKSLGR